MAFDFATDRERLFDVTSSITNEASDEKVSLPRETRTIVSDNAKIEQFKIEIGERLSKHFDLPLTGSR